MPKSRRELIAETRKREQVRQARLRIIIPVLVLIPVILIILAIWVLQP